MFKKLVLIAVVLTALFTLASPVFAQSGQPGTYYVFPGSGDNTEDGTEAHPFKTFTKAIDAARHNPYGGVICFKATNDAPYDCRETVKTTNPPHSGASISRTALFVILGFASLILVVVGWFLRRRSRTLPSQP